MIKAEGLEAARRIAKWKKSKNLWRARASIVAFANQAHRGDSNLAGFTDIVIDNCTTLVKRNERFAQKRLGGHCVSWLTAYSSRPYVGKFYGGP